MPGVHRVGAGLTPAPPTPPDVRVRIRRFARIPETAVGFGEPFQAKVGPVGVGQGAGEDGGARDAPVALAGARPFAGVALGDA